MSWLSRETGEPYRLLSEAEWEYAARAGTETARYWGEDEVGQCGYANGADQTWRDHGWNWVGGVSCSDGYADTAPVGSFAPNGWGLYDMLGNVWEWTEDCWHYGYEGAPSDGSVWQGSDDCSNRVLRGGSANDYPVHLRSALGAAWTLAVRADRRDMEARLGRRLDRVEARIMEAIREWRTPADQG